MKMTPAEKSTLIDVFLSALLVVGAAGAQDTASRQAPHAGGAETVDVELKTVPFYAVDEAGEPVYDLTLDELVILVDGEPTSPDTLDRWSKEDPRSEGARVKEDGASEPAAKPRQARQVFLLFDEAFSTKSAWNRSLRVAKDVVGRLPATDHLHLLVHDSVNGLQYMMGPASGTSGRQAMHATIAKLKPGAMFLRSRLERTGLPSYLGPSGATGVGAQEKNAYEAAGRLARAEYQAVAVNLAGHFETLAMTLKQISAPKLLMVFSSGIERRFYFDGTYGFKPGSNSLGSYHGAAARLEPIRGTYEKSLAKLAGSGVVPIFVNPGERRGAGSDTLDHMSRTTGGLFLDGGSLKTLGEKILGASSAYYEAGFYLSRQPAVGAAAKLDVEVRRPGVRVVFPNRLKSRLEYSSMSDEEKRFAIMDLARRGVASPPMEVLHPLEGQLLRRSEEPAVAFAASWPATVRDQPLDLYDVVLDMAKGAPKLVRFERSELPASTRPPRIEQALPRDNAVVWAIVAVEPASGEAYLRRLRLEPGI